MSRSKNRTITWNLIVALCAAAALSLGLWPNAAAKPTGRVKPPGGTVIIPGGGAAGGGFITVDPITPTIDPLPTGPDPSIFEQPLGAVPAPAPARRAGQDCEPSAANNYCSGEAGGGDEAPCECRDSPIAHSRCCAYPYRRY